MPTQSAIERMLEKKKKGQDTSGRGFGNSRQVGARASATGRVGVNKSSTSRMQDRPGDMTSADVARSQLLGDQASRLGEEAVGAAALRVPTSASLQTSAMMAPRTDVDMGRPMQQSMETEGLMPGPTGPGLQAPQAAADPNFVPLPTANAIPMANEQMAQQIIDPNNPNAAQPGLNPFDKNARMAQAVAMLQRG